MLLYKQYIKLPLKVQWPWPGSFPTLHACKATMDYSGSTPIYPSWGSGCLCWTLLIPSGTQQGLSQPPVLLSSLPSMHAPGTVLMASVRVGGCLQPTTQGQVPLGLLVALACAGCPGQWEAGEVSGWGGLVGSSCFSRKVIHEEHVFRRACSILEPSPFSLSGHAGLATWQWAGRKLVNNAYHDHHHNNRSLLYIASSPGWELGKDGETSAGSKSQLRLLSWS